MKDLNDYTLEVHGCHAYDATGAISEPIYLSATYRHPGYKQSTGFDYGRVANPTRKELEDVLAKLERGQRAWAVSSGMAAINMVLHLLNRLQTAGVQFIFLPVIECQRAAQHFGGAHHVQEP